MRLPRFLKEDQIDLWFEPLVDTPDPWELPTADDLEGSDDGELSDREVFKLKERVIQHLCEMLERSGRVTNPRKLYTDLRNREAKASTGIGSQIAMPHVRTQQAKGFAMAVARAPEPGLPWSSIDDEPATPQSIHWLRARMTSPPVSASRSWSRRSSPPAKAAARLRSTLR